MPAARESSQAASAPKAAGASAAAQHWAPAADGPRSAAAAAEPADSQPVVRLSEPAADAERRSWASPEAGADRGWKWERRKAEGRPRPELRSMPAMPEAALRARSRPAGGFHDRSPSPPAMTTAPPRRACG